MLAIGGVALVLLVLVGPRPRRGALMGEGSPLAGVRVGQVAWPADTVLACIVRDARPLAPSPDDTLEGRDELLFVTGHEADEQALERLLTRGPASS